MRYIFYIDDEKLEGINASNVIVDTGSKSIMLVTLDPAVKEFARIPYELKIIRVANNGVTKHMCYLNMVRKVHMDRPMYINFLGGQDDIISDWSLWD